MEYLPRHIEPFIREHISFFPVTAVLGPRQCGKSTLIKEFIKRNEKAIYLDLEIESNREMLQNPEQFFKHNQDKQICLDEIQRMPDIFKSLRSAVDQNRIPGKFIILGSAARDLIKQSSETLAGRIGYLELTPFFLPEVKLLRSQTELWMQGGFPDSILSTLELSKLWRINFIRTFLERDIPQIGFSIPADSIGRLWRMLAHYHGQILNLSNLGKSMGVSHNTIRSYVDLLNQTFMTREIKPFEGNLKKRLIKTPKIYIRDSGILHSLLNIEDFNQLLYHPVFGFSWEGFVIETVCSLMPDYDIFFYRTSHGAELDLILQKGNTKIALECKISDAPKPTKGFWIALEDVIPDATFIVSPNAQKYPIGDNIWVVGIFELLQSLEQFINPGRNLTD